MVSSFNLQQSNKQIKMASTRRVDNLRAQISGARRVSAPVVNSCANSAELRAAVGKKNPDDVVVVSALRTAIGKARKGSFRNTTPDTLLTGVLKGVLKQVEGKVKPQDVQDVSLGSGRAHFGRILCDGKPILLCSPLFSSALLWNVVHHFLYSCYRRMVFVEHDLLHPLPGKCAVVVGPNSFSLPPSH